MTEPMTSFGLRHIGQIRIQVTDVERAVTFYRDALGMSFLYAFPGMAFFDVDGVRLMLVEPEGRRSAASRRSTTGSTTSARR